MTALQLQRKLRGKCLRCEDDAGETNLCEKHRLELCARVAASTKKRRAAARLLAPSISRAA
jgi:hypothetical protein